jgi:hypothetical protein
MHCLLPIPLTFRFLQERIQVNTKEFDNEPTATTTNSLAISLSASCGGRGLTMATFLVVAAASFIDRHVHDNIRVNVLHYVTSMQA